MTTQIASIAGEDVLGYELRIEAPPEVVWRFWVEPEAIVRWMGTTATLDPRPGGLFRIDYGQGDVVAGEYVELHEPRRLVITWGWESADDPVQGGGSRVEVELEPADGGAATLLRLRHNGLPEPSRISHDEGWRYFLPRLVEAATSD
jgi:uncharacterized protein YndB with AHSA1/START domain